MSYFVVDKWLYKSVNNVKTKIRSHAHADEFVFYILKRKQPNLSKFG